jgi:pimeloyl-ACP methyl ester carboxylesterase
MIQSILVLLLLLTAPLFCHGESPGDPAITVYLFPGQGADYRLFRDLKFPEGYDTVHISYPVPQKRETMKEFAEGFIPLIDQGAPFILVGVSLGGMICTELADTLHPEKTILISSAKAWFELPGHYTFMRKFHLDRIIPKGMVKAGARILQGLVEPDRKQDPETFKDMLKKKDPLYLKRTGQMIISWEREDYHPDIYHIHGDADNTIPIRNLICDYVVEDGSHMMTLTRADEISLIIREILRGE